MTPTHLSMSHEGKETLLRIVEEANTLKAKEWGLDGDLLVSPEDGLVADLGYAQSEYHKFIALCSPDAISAIAAYVAAVEKERDELRERLQFDPGGGDAIDAAESAMGHLRAEIERLRSELSTARSTALLEAAEIADETAHQYGEGLCHYEEGDPEKLRQFGALQGAAVAAAAIRKLAEEA